MQIFDLKIDSVGNFRKQELNLTLSQGGMLLENRQVQVEMGDLLFAEVTGLRGTCHLIREGKNSSDALRECGLYLYDKFIGDSMGKKILTGGKTLLKIQENKTDRKTPLIPWEILRDQENYLIKKGLVITRFPIETCRNPSAPITVVDQLRILILASQPRDMEHLAISKEIGKICSLFDAFNIGMDIQVDVLTYGCTRERLMDILVNRLPYHVLHYIGSAAKNKLLLEDHDGISEPFYGDELVEMFTQIGRTPPLVVFTSPSRDVSFWKDRRKSHVARDSQERESSRLDRFIGVSYDLASSGLTSAVVSFRREMESHALYSMQREFYYQLIQHNLSISESFLSAQALALNEMSDQWFFPALYGGDAVNRPFIFKKTKKSKRDKKIRLTDLVSSSFTVPSDFLGRYRELSEIAKQVIYGNVFSLCLLGEEGVGKTTLAARMFDIWRREYDGVFCYTFFPECTLEEFWLDFRAFAIRNRLFLNLSRTEIEGRSLPERQKIIRDQIQSTLSCGRYLLILDNFQAVLEKTDSEISFKDKGFEDLFHAIFLHNNLFVKTLICSSCFPEYLSHAPYNVSILKLSGLDYNDIPSFTEKAPRTDEFIRKLTTEERIQFYRIFRGIPPLLEFFEKYKENERWYEALKSQSFLNEKGEVPLQESFALLFNEISPDVKKLLSLLVRMNRDIFLPLLLKAFSAKKEDEIEGFAEAKRMGFLHVSKSKDSFMPDRIEVASIVSAYYSENPADLDIFEREHQFYLKQYGRKAIDLGRKWIEKEDSERGLYLLLSAWDYLFSAGDFSSASTLLKEIWQPLSDMCLFEKTRRMFEALIEPIQDNREKIVMLRLLGNILMSEGASGKMENLFQKTLEINRFQGDKAEISSDLYELGSIEIERGFFDKALGYLRESLDIRTKLELEEEKADVLVKIAEIYRAKKEISTAIDFYSHALEIRKIQENNSGCSAILAFLSDIYFRFGDYGRSMELDVQKIEFDQASNNSYQMAQTLLHMVDLQVKMEKYEEALSLLNKCMILEKHLDDQLVIASVLLKISEIKLKQDHLKEALLYCEQSRQINHQLNHLPGLAANYRQLSFIYHNSKEPEEAIKYASKSLDIYSEIADIDNSVNSLLHLGEVYLEMNDFERTLFFYQQALEIRRDQEEMGEIAFIQNKIANLYYLKGDTDQAIEHYEQSLSIYKHLDRLAKTAEVLHQMATIYKEQGNLSLAIELYEQSLAINKELDNPAAVALTLGQIGRILEEEEKFCKAIGKYATSLAIFRHLKSGYEELATEDLTKLKRRMPDVEYKWCVTAGLEEHAPYLENIEIEGKDF